MHYLVGYGDNSHLLTQDSSGLNGWCDACSSDLNPLEQNEVTSSQVVLVIRYLIPHTSL